MRIVGAPTNKSFIALMRAWPKRMRTFSRVATYYVAQQVYEQLLRRIPAGRAFRAYRQSLRLVEIAARKQHPSFAIIAKPRSKASGLRPKQFLIYVRARRKLAPTPGPIRVLEEHSPWTEATLPFKPKDSEAVLEYQKVTQVKFKKITKEREGQRREWEKKLQRLGVKIASGAAGIPTEAPNVIQDGLQLEFGRGETPARPHWRPVLRALDRKGILGMIRQRLLGRRYMERMFTQLKEPRFKIPRLEVISSQQAGRLKEFSTRILGRG